MQRNCRPHRAAVLLINAMPAQKVARGIGTVDLESIAPATVLIGQALPPIRCFRAVGRLPP
jgi:hypothetical protein